MHKKEITLDTFRRDTEKVSGFLVDVNALMGSCGASPVHMRYKADRIIIKDIYPETILIPSGKSYMTISQIRKIVKEEPSDTKGCKPTYKITCGWLEEMKTVVKITQT